MSYNGILRATATATTNPDPTTLGTQNPYPTTYTDRYTASGTWTTQSSTNCKAVISRDQSNSNDYAALRFGFIPSSGGAVTYTATFWAYVSLAATWVKLQGQSYSLTGNCDVVLQLNAYPISSNDPIFVQLSSVSAGSLTIYFDNGLATPL